MTNDKIELVVQLITNQIICRFQLSSDDPLGAIIAIDLFEQYSIDRFGVKRTLLIGMVASMVGLMLLAEWTRL